MEVLSASPLRVASILWQPMRGVYILTVVCKATYALLPTASILADVQDDPSEGDDYWDDDERRSLSSASDLVPFKQGADVHLIGYAYAPPDHPGGPVLTRLVVGDGLVDKSIEVHGDRAWTADGRLLEESRFSRVALRWERAAGGPGTPNPVGIPANLAPDHRNLRQVPNLQPPGLRLRAPGEVIPPVGYGPIAPIWPERIARLRKHASTWNHRSWNDAPLPVDIDKSFFNAAPSDQRLEQIQGDEQLVLEGLHPHFPRLTTRLRLVTPRAQVERKGVSDKDVQLRCDTLAIDTNRGVCSLTWRGWVPLASAEEPGRVVVTCVMGASPPLAAEPPRKDDDRGEGTVALSAARSAGAALVPVLPFVESLTGTTASPGAASAGPKPQDSAPPPRMSGLPFVESRPPAPLPAAESRPPAPPPAANRPAAPPPPAASRPAAPPPAAESRPAAPPPPAASRPAAPPPSPSKNALFFDDDEGTVQVTPAKARRATLVLNADGSSGTIHVPALPFVESPLVESPLVESPPPSAESRPGPASASPVDAGALDEDTDIEEDLLTLEDDPAIVHAAPEKMRRATLVPSDAERAAPPAPALPFADSTPPRATEPPPPPAPFEEDTRTVDDEPSTMAATPEKLRRATLPFVQIALAAASPSALADPLTQTLRGTSRLRDATSAQPSTVEARTPGSPETQLPALAALMAEMRAPVLTPSAAQAQSPGLAPAPAQTQSPGLAPAPAPAQTQSPGLAPPAAPPQSPVLSSSAASPQARGMVLSAAQPQGPGLGLSLAQPPAPEQPPAAPPPAQQPLSAQPSSDAAQPPALAPPATQPVQGPARMSPVAQVPRPSQRPPSFAATLPAPPPLPASAPGTAPAQSPAPHPALRAPSSPSQPHPALRAPSSPSQPHPALRAPSSPPQPHPALRAPSSPPQPVLRSPSSPPQLQPPPHHPLPGEISAPGRPSLPAETLAPALAPLPAAPPMIGPLAAWKAPDADRPTSAPPAGTAPATSLSPSPSPAVLDLDPADVSIERFAAISAEIAEQRAPRAAVLDAHALTEGSWTAIERHWTGAIREAAGRGDHGLQAESDRAYVTAVEGFRGPITGDEHARIVASLAQGQTNPVLDALRIQRPALMPILRSWTKRVAADRSAASAATAALAALGTKPTP
ncbi:DUF2169 family type VI secretion system accessory protein [Chondromyces apiculatus]|uniref:DUF2169 domain-containing protein n=1 Tax=Chondromyces apiculatus DSM 436 TaxID=1192034 RepID=A0A017T816_9BACT|nr:DUF2169 domain-containing protein [Chondromyces apiculatus]EYF05087.1 Hypothetical protein CAP_3677 [Chondromyces apiculatus DSM 436]